MKNQKRILSVTLKRMFDDSPDTSYLGEYASRSNSEYSIDRAHSEDCASLESNHREGVDKLERILEYVNTRLIETENDADGIEWESLEETTGVLASLQDDLMECDCNGGDMERNQYRYFNPCHENYKGLPEAEIRKYCRQDYDRMESLNRGNWYYLGIRAEAAIRVPYMTEGRGGRTYFRIDPLSSCGLFGIESDSEESHIESIEKEELAELKMQLKALGFSTRAISTAFKNVERKDA